MHVPAAASCQPPPQLRPTVADSERQLIDVRVAQREHEVFEKVPLTHRRHALVCVAEYGSKPRTQSAGQNHTDTARQIVWIRLLTPIMHVVFF